MIVMMMFYELEISYLWFSSRMPSCCDYYAFILFSAIKDTSKIEIVTISAKSLLEQKPEN